MLIDVRRHSAIAVAFGLLAAMLYAGGTAGATAGTPAQTPACPQATSTDPAADAVAASDSTGATDPVACASGVAGSLCMAVWHTAAPLLRGRIPGIALLCMAMTLPARTPAQEG